MPRCSIIKCGASKSKHHPDITFHRMPLKKAVRRKWLDIIGIGNLNPRHKEWYVCSQHFEKESFNKTLEVTRLRDDTLPLTIRKLGSKHNNEDLLKEKYLNYKQMIDNVSGDNSSEQSGMKVNCVNCNDILNIEHRIPVLQLDVAFISKVAEKIFPDIVTDSDCICEKCIDNNLKSVSVSPIDGNWSPQPSDVETQDIDPGITDSDDSLYDEDIEVGPWVVCSACGRTTSRSNSELILNEYPTNKHLMIQEYILKNMAPRLVNPEDRVCKSCYKIVDDTIQKNIEKETPRQHLKRKCVTKSHVKAVTQSSSSKKANDSTKATDRVFSDLTPPLTSSKREKKLKSNNNIENVSKDTSYLNDNKDTSTMKENIKLTENRIPVKHIVNIMPDRNAVVHMSDQTSAGEEPDRIKKAVTSDIQEVVKPGHDTSGQLYLELKPLRTNDGAAIENNKTEAVSMEEDNINKTEIRKQIEYAMIYRVYQYLKLEFNLWKDVCEGHVDMNPLSNIVQRTALATGVTEQVVKDVLKNTDNEKIISPEQGGKERPVCVDQASSSIIVKDKQKDVITNKIIEQLKDKNELNIPVNVVMKYGPERERDGLSDIEYLFKNIREKMTKQNVLPHKSSSTQDKVKEKSKPSNLRRKSNNETR